MATLTAYVQAMRDRQVVIARKLGSDITQRAKQDRVDNLSVLVLLATVIKTLVDKGVITDAELTATLDAARDAGWPDEPFDPPAPT